MQSSQIKDTAKLLETVQLQEKQIQEFERLNTILGNIFSTMNVDETIQRITQGAMELCNADQASISLIGSPKRNEALTLIREGEASDEKLDSYLNKLLVGWVSRNNQALLSQDLNETFGEDNVLPRHRDITSVMAVPLVQHEKMIGVINLITQKTGKLFQENHLQLMKLLVPQCAQFIANARLHETLFEETIRLKKQIRDKYEFQGIIGRSPKMQAVFSLLESIIPTDVRALIQGESGTGKERIARAIHYSGPHKDAAFVAVDCGALPANLLESELFGYMKGAFTGANRDHKGLFEEADGGTLFLDEIGNMPPEIQVKFLRAIQEGEIRPLGSSRTKKVDVRIIAATNEDLQEQVKTGEFRQDLYYRLNVVNIPLPPLRERKEDIAILANHFLEQAKTRYKKRIGGFNPEAIAHLENYTWPGNIRELENTIERAVVLCKSQELSKTDFPFLETPLDFDDQLFQPRPWEEAIFELKQRYLAKVLAHTGGIKKDAAEILNIQPAYLSRLLKNLEIKTEL